MSPNIQLFATHVPLRLQSTVWEAPGTLNLISPNLYLKQVTVQQHMRQKSFCLKKPQHIRTSSTFVPNYSASVKSSILNFSCTTTQYLVGWHVKIRGGGSSQKVERLIDWGEPERAPH